jgi:hypothetical protein
MNAAVQREPQTNCRKREEKSQKGREGGKKQRETYEDGRLHVAAVGTDHVGGDNGHDGVPEPVRGGGEGDTAGTDGKGEDLSDEDPSTGSPGGGEEEDGDGDEGDLGTVEGKKASQYEEKKGDKSPGRWKSPVLRKGGE